MADRAITVDRIELLTALDGLLGFVPEFTPPGFGPDNPCYEEGDETAPLASEAMLYCLFGKEDGRSVLHHLNELVNVLGYGNVYEVRAAAREAKKEIEELDEERDNPDDPMYDIHRSLERLQDQVRTVSHYVKRGVREIRNRNQGEKGE